MWNTAISAAIPFIASLHTHCTKMDGQWSASNDSSSDDDGVNSLRLQSYATADNILTNVNIVKARFPLYTNPTLVHYSQSLNFNPVKSPSRCLLLSDELLKNLIQLKSIGSQQMSGDELAFGIRKQQCPSMITWSGMTDCVEKMRHFSAWLSKRCEWFGDKNNPILDLSDVVRSLCRRVHQLRDKSIDHDKQRNLLCMLYANGQFDDVQNMSLLVKDVEQMCIRIDRCTSLVNLAQTILRQLVFDSHKMVQTKGIVHSFKCIKLHVPRISSPCP